MAYTQNLQAIAEAMERLLDRDLEIASRAQQPLDQRPYLVIIYVARQARKLSSEDCIERALDWQRKGEDLSGRLKRAHDLIAAENNLIKNWAQLSPEGTCQSSQKIATMALDDLRLCNGFARLLQLLHMRD